MTSALKWFGVKTLYRVTVSGRPVATDASYAARTAMLEERIVILRARDFRSAIALAEREARTYARGHKHRNPYGQRVAMKYLGSCDAFHMFEPPDDLPEVFSTTEVIDARMSVDTLIDRRLGRKEGRDRDRRRKMFLNAEFNGAVRRK